MPKRIAVKVLLLAAAAIIPGQSQNSDPRANDPTGNGPPAVVITQDKNQDGSPDETKSEKKKAAAERPISGLVTDASGKPVIGAIVQLENMRTLQVRSFITHDKGEYYFAGLNKDVDYKVKAQFQGHISQSRTLSSFDTKAEPVINLQIR